MKRFVLGLVFFVALTIASPSTNQATINDTAIDEDALLAFSMLRTQIREGQVRDRTVPMLPIFMQKTPLTEEQKLFLLTSTGLDHEMSQDILQLIMPVLKAECKSTDETVMTLLVISKTICKNSTECSANADLMIPLLRSGSDMGCGGSAMTTTGNTSAPGEMCRCEDQTNALFWVSLWEQLTQTHSRRNTSIPDQLPIAISILLDQRQCDGKLKYDRSKCSCSAINKGIDSIFLQYVITSEDIQKKLSPAQKLAIRETLAIPRQRQFGGSNINIQDYLTSIIAPSADPTLLAILNNPGAPTSDLIRQIILSSIGLDSSLLHVILNGGFGNDADRVALIRYLTNLGILDASFLPLILGVESGQQFFISSLIEAGQIDPTTALLLLGTSNGFSNTQILNLLIAAINNQDNPDFFSSLGRPYIPPLPEGVFPGSRLFFPHFETLGVNTCALHDLRNRFECGYIGISAEECENVPYCCYSPVFLTDIEVRNATNSQITAASAVPWCYYNIFFIYYDTFFLPILRPGEFAAPIRCAPLYRFGIGLDPSLVALIDPSGTAFASLVIPRSECGFPGITEFQCVAVRGCCWDRNAPFRVPQCYVQNGADGIAFDYSNVPAAYAPANGSCNVNVYQIPILYYQRVACHYTLEFHNIGYNLLSFPTRFDCLTKLGCCWEDNDSTIDEYPFTPRCYQRVGGFSIPSNVPGLNDLILRSGNTDDSSFAAEQERRGFPPAHNSK